MKKFSKLLGFIVVFITVMAAFCTVSFAATVGEPLTSPEEGWKRIDDTSNKIIYNNFRPEIYSGNYLGAYHLAATANASINFKFYGTKVRIIAPISTNGYTTNVVIKIDGISDTFSEYGGIYTAVFQTLVYEKTNLPNGIHTVEIISTDAKYTTFDAVDIDETGYLIDATAPTNLAAVPSTSKVDLLWDAIDGATSYNVKRSTNSGGPYETIGTSTSNEYTDYTVANGTAYYYVVTAVVSGVESPNSNEASATPTAPPAVGNPAILEITMVTGEIKEYDLTAVELQDFLTWYDSRSDGTGKAYYVINKKNNIKPFLSRKEYLAYDKISSFEVNEYTE